MTGGLYGSKVGKRELIQSGRTVKVKSELNPCLTGCRPYSVAPCEHHVNGTRPPCQGTQETPKCEERCIDGYSTSYPKDKHFGNSVQPWSAISHLVIVAGAISLWFHILQVNARTASPPSRSRSWLSCTRTAPWRQPLLSMQIFCSTRPVRMLQCLFFLNWVHILMLNVAAGVYQHVTGDILGGHAIKILGWGEENGTPYWLAANSWNGDWGDKGWPKTDFLVLNKYLI